MYLMNPEKMAEREGGKPQKESRPGLHFSLLNLSARGLLPSRARGGLCSDVFWDKNMKMATALSLT